MNISEINETQFNKIRYRYKVFDNDDKKLHDVIFINYENNSVEWYNNKDKKRSEFIDNIHLVQCTSLKDKNGKLIFEGDIVRYIKKTETSIFTVKTEILFQIEWKNFKWKVKPIKIVKGSTGDIQGFDLHDIYKIDAYEQHQTEILTEVIGNIYENPELLSEANYELR